MHHARQALRALRATSIRCLTPDFLPLSHWVLVTPPHIWYISILLFLLPIKRFALTRIVRLYLAIIMHFPTILSPALLVPLSLFTLHPEPTTALNCCLSGICGARRHARDISAPAGLLEVRVPVPAGCCCFAGSLDLCKSVCVRHLSVICRSHASG
jgi:hypothetical protein